MRCPIRAPLCSNIACPPIGIQLHNYCIQYSDHSCMDHRTPLQSCNTRFCQRKFEFLVFSQESWEVDSLLVARGYGDQTSPVSRDSTSFQGAVPGKKVSQFHSQLKTIFVQHYQWRTWPRQLQCNPSQQYFCPWPGGGGKEGACLLLAVSGYIDDVTYRYYMVRIQICCLALASDSNLQYTPGPALLIQSKVGPSVFRTQPLKSLPLSTICPHPTPCFACC